MGAALAGCRAVAVPGPADGPASTWRAVADGRRRAGPVLWVNSPANPTGGLTDLAAVAAVGPAPRRPGLLRRVLRRVHLGRAAPRRSSSPGSRAWSPCTRCPSGPTWPACGPASTPATPSWWRTCARCASTPGSWCPGRSRRPRRWRWPTTTTSRPSASATASGCASWPTCSPRRAARSPAGRRLLPVGPGPRPLAPTAGRWPPTWPRRAGCWSARATSTARPAGLRPRGRGPAHGAARPGGRAAHRLGLAVADSRCLRPAPVASGHGGPPQRRSRSSGTGRELEPGRRRGAGGASRRPIDLLDRGEARVAEVGRTGRSSSTSG